MFEIQAQELPAIRIAQSIGGGYSKNLLFVVGGGLGDRVCAEPTIRYCSEQFKGCDISLVCSTPEIFRHIKFKQIYLKGEDVPKNTYLPIYTYAQGNTANQFFNANLMHSVDFASISAFRGQLPTHARSPHLEPLPPKDNKNQLHDIANNDHFILCHLGKTWESRTFTASWWQSMIWEIKKKGYTAVLVGKECIDIDLVSGTCLDLRERLSLNDFMWVCKNSANMVTNDSSSLHFAATGKGRIAFIPTCRHPDLITHWRIGKFGGNMKAFYKEPMWEMFDNCPNNLDELRISKVPSLTKIDEYMPNPEDIIKWIQSYP